MKVLLIFINLLFFSTVNAQDIVYIDPDAHLSAKEKEQKKLRLQQHTLKKIGGTFHIYPGFHVITSEPTPFYCHSTSIDYLLGNRDSSVLIGLTLTPRDSADYKRDEKILKKSIENYNPDHEWLANFRADVDSSRYKPVFFSSKKLKKYNADGGVEYKRGCRDFHKGNAKELFLGTYENEKSIILNKKYRGIIEIHYFIRANTIADIDKYIRRAAKMIYYN